MTDSIAVSEFVRRQTLNSRFSHYEKDWLELLGIVQAHFRDAKTGYRDGVVLVPVPPENFRCGVVQLQEGDVLVGTYEARQEGEEPRKQVGVPAEGLVKQGRVKTKAVSVDIVLYRHDVLAENDERSSEAEWEIISINASPTEGEMPMHPGTLMANHFQLSGGTATNMSNDEFVEALRKSVLYWKDKSMLLPAK